MQFNGVGKGHDSQMHMHHVTDCVFDHAHYRKKEESAASGSGMESQALDMTQKEQEGELSLSAWLDRMFGKGKGFLRGFWNGSGSAVRGVTEGREDIAGTGSLTGRQASDSQDISAPGAAEGLHSAQVSAASASVPPPRMIENNPYFSAIEDTGRKQENLWQKVRVKVRDVSGRLAGHLPGNFFQTGNQDSFQSNRQKPKTDLRKHSRYHEDKLEIDCVLTDDSYLLDSYDRKGEYSRLSAKK